jgi:molybdopterin-guanine dinucleotide biosynthesis protein A
MKLAAIVLAGGAATRLGGVDKPGLAVRGVPMIERVLAAVEGASPRIVVGPDRDGLPEDVVVVREEPVGGGPVVALAAGLALVPEGGRVAVLAADLPMLTPSAIATLSAATQSTVDGALFVDDTGRRQFLCGVWWTDSLRGALGDARSMKALIAGLTVVEVVGPGTPWYDCDTEEDLRKAER